MITQEVEKAIDDLHCILHKLFGMCLDCNEVCNKARLEHVELCACCKSIANV